MEILYVICGIVGGGVAAGVPLYLKLRSGLQDIRRDERKLAEDEFTRTVERLNRDIANRDARFGSLESRFDALEAEHARCFQESAHQKAEIKILRFQVEQLRRMSEAVAVVTNVTADLTGTVVDAESTVKDVLGWRPEDLIGKNVDVLIPRDLRSKHHAGLERVRTSGLIRPDDVAIRAYARHASGERVPVIVTLTGWVDDAGRKLISAQIMHRREFVVVVDADPGTAESPRLPPSPPTGSGVFKTTPVKMPPGTDGPAVRPPGN